MISGRVNRRALRRGALGVALVTTSAVIASCGIFDNSTTPAEEAPATIVVNSPDFGDGLPLPVQFSCDGEGVTPTISWSGIPPETQGVAVVIDSPDAPNDSTFTHWIVLDIPPTVTQLVAGAVPPEATTVVNSSGTAAFDPVCNRDSTARFRFQVIALDELTDLNDDAALDEALEYIDDKALARGQIVGTYTRRDQ